MKKKVLISWSTGKDSAWSLYHMLRDSRYEIAGLFCTVNKKFARTAMHAVRLELLKLQAERLALPLDIIEIPYPCGNADYEEIMGRFVEKAKKRGVDGFAFGDLFLEDIRAYRVRQLKESGIRPIFPLWQQDTTALAREMIAGGLKTVITCIDPNKLSATFAGREYNEDLLRDLPAGIDPCGENGEFHTFVYDAPMFREAIAVTVGPVVERDGFIFADVRPGQ